METIVSNHNLLQPHTYHKQSIFQLAKNHCLPEYLDISSICSLPFPVPSTSRSDMYKNHCDQNRYKEKLINACLDKELKFKGTIDDWSSTDDKPYPLPRFARDATSPLYEALPSRIKGKYIKEADTTHCSIHKNEFKLYLINSKAWPITGLLINWWAADSFKSNQNNKNREDFEFLNQPNKKDAWFEVINTLSTTLYSQKGEKPSSAELWGQLIENPPGAYIITQSIEKGEECIKMRGEPSLSLSAFKKRWKNYTAPPKNT